MPRYLMFISYLGTRFRGIQKQVSKINPESVDPFSVQSMLEIALNKFKPKCPANVVISSRTDAGVHALRSAVHVDLENEYVVYDPLRLVSGVNRYFEKSDIAIRVQECQIVPDTFHARHNAVSRSYLYRLAVRKADAPQLPLTGKEYVAQIPFHEWRRCHFIQNSEFDEEKFSSTAKLFVGEKDFRTFMGSLRLRSTNKEVKTIRNIESVNITVERPSFTGLTSSSSGHYKYFNIIFKSNGFVYRQVRRMVGALIAVAEGKIHHCDVEQMLSTPSQDSWKSCVQLAPAHGLYLINIEYNLSDIICAHDKSSDVNINEQIKQVLVSET